MTSRGPEVWRILLAAIAVVSLAGDASAQPRQPQALPSPALKSLSGQITIGDIVYVTDAAGSTSRGQLSALSDRSVQVRDKGRLRTFAAGEVRRIQRQQPDSPITGVLIGAAAGSVPGLSWLIADPNECTGLCAEDYAAIAVGAIVGGLIDRAIHKRVTVYEAGGGRRGARVLIGPLLARDRPGIQVTLKP